MPSLKFVPFVFALVPVATPLLAGEAVSNQALGLRLTVPDGFVRAPEAAKGKALFAFQRPPVGDQKAETFIAVSRLGGVIGRERLDPKQVAARAPQVTVVTEKWKTFDIDVTRVPEQVDDIAMLTFNAQVPLKPEAVQVSVTGEAGREEELRAVMQSVLDNLEGQSNWLNAQERSERLADGITQLIVAAGMLAGVGFVIVQLVRKRKKPRDRDRRPPSGGKHRSAGEHEEDLRDR